MKHKFTREQLEQMRSCEFLTDRERRVFKLYYMRGWDIEAIAAEMDYSRRTIDRDLQGIRRKISVGAG